MKILVVSDSQGSIGAILTALDREKPNVLIHLGNGIKDLADVKFDGQIYASRGKTDFNPKIAKAGKVAHNGCEILYTYGQDLDIVNGYDKLYEFALTKGAKVVLFGQTDHAELFERDGIIFANPGTIKDPQTGSYLTITFKGNTPIIEHFKLA